MPRAFTFASVAASLLGLLLTAMLTQYYDIVLGVSFSSEHTLALPAIWAFGLIAIVGGVTFAISRTRLLNRAEMLCVMYVMLLAAPLMTQGFWHRAVAIMATNPRNADFEKMDAMNDRIWPHGPNLLPKVFDSKEGAGLVSRGGYSWEEAECEKGKRASVPVLANKAAEDVSWVRVTLPLERDGKTLLAPGEPCMISVLVRPTELGPKTFFYCRAFEDDQTRYAQWFQSSESPKISFLHQTGFRRVGAYGVKLSADARKTVTLEFGLSGRGRVEFHDPKFFSVGALESLYKGKKLVTESEYAALLPIEKTHAVVRPDRLVSWAGLKYGLSGYIPLADWREPLFSWTSFIGLILLAMLAVNIIMRKQWLESERFLMPVARIPLALVEDGSGTDADGHKRVPIWRQRLMWIGFAVSLLWMLWAALASRNPKVPNPAISFRLADYLSDPGWGQMWNRVRFEINPIFLAMSIFMELNVLLSMVVGYLVYRSQFWIGNVSGLTADVSFPYGEYQCAGSYMAYALVVVFFARKYLLRVLRTMFGRGDAEDVSDTGAYRAAGIILVVTTVGIAQWAHWLGISVAGMLLFFGFLLTLGFVTSRIRTECGAPWGYFTPGNAVVFIGLMGGMSIFGPALVLFCYIASFMLGPTVFFQIPGTQMELLELGRRWNVRWPQILGFTILAILGGMLIGAWVFLSNAYALGGDSVPYQWAFDTKWWYFFPFNLELGTATAKHLGQAAGAAQAAANPAWIAMGSAAAVTIVVATLRQFFAGFWFHPVGVVLGATNFLDYIWGSALTAWVIRLVVLRFGGAATVKNKLHPLFVGVFLGAAVGYLVMGILTATARSAGIEWTGPTLTPP